MSWKLVEEGYYRTIFGKSQSVFHSSLFNKLNAKNVDEIYHLIWEMNDVQFGVILGLKNKTLFSPFSSPFGGIESTEKDNYSAKTDIILSLIEFCANLNANKIQITLPPAMYFRFGNFTYTENYLSAGFKELFVDQSYHIDLKKHTEFQSALKRNALKNLKKGQASDHRFSFCSSFTEQENAYQVIQQNRNERGYPLKLSLEQLRHTSQVVPIHYFSINIEGNKAAAAVVYEVTEDIAMVVYWGHLRSAEAFRPINLLSFYLYNHFKERGFSILDIGPSSEKGILNEGLANFKLSLGCEVSEKSTLCYEY